MADGYLLYQCPEWRALWPGREELRFEHGLYPNDEQWVKIQPPVEPLDTITVAVRFGDHHDLDRQIFRLFLLLEAVRHWCQRVEIFIPYLPYSLQDRDVRGGDATAQRVLLDTLAVLGVSKIFVADIHSSLNLGGYEVPVVHLPTERLLADALRATVGNRLLAVVAPDKGAIGKAARFGEYLHAPVYQFYKDRHGPGAVSVSSVADVTSCPAGDLVVVDDMINTGGTLVAIIQSLREQCDARVWVVITHGLFAGQATKKLQESGVEKIITTDSFDSGAMRSNEHGRWLEIVSFSDFAGSEAMLQ